MVKKFLLLFIIILTGCSFKQIEYIEDPQNTMIKDYTYKFIGESKHFYFQSGIANYNDLSRDLWISNFGTKKNLPKNTTFFINISFNNISLFGDMDKTDMKSIDKIKEFQMFESGTIQYDSKGNILGESDAFTQSTKGTFKNGIEIEVTYCIKQKCQKEKMDIKIIEQR